MNKAVNNAKSKLIATFERLKKIKNIRFIACVFILAIVLLIYSAVRTSSEPDALSAVTQTEATMTAEEQRVAGVLEQIDGVGSVVVLINKSENGSCKSAVVVAEGAENVAIKLRLLEAVETALQVDGSAVEIYAMK